MSSQAQVGVIAIVTNDERFVALVKAVREAEAKEDAAWVKHRAAFVDRWYPSLSTNRFGEPPKVTRLMLSSNDMLTLPDLTEIMDELAHAKIALANYLLGLL